METPALDLTIITGLSGSGKSTATHAFEDRGYFCIDNLPVALIPELLRTILQSGSDVTKVVLGVDARERHFLDEFENVSEKVRQDGHHLKIIFLEAGMEVLLRRFSETRRRHPLAGFDVQSALKEEQRILEVFRANATRIIDTSTMTVHDLKREIFHVIDSASSTCNTSITLLSFGHKYGVPLEADLMFDVRCLPNPYFEENLRTLSGLDDMVFDYVFSFEESRAMRDKIQDFVRFSLPLFEKEGKMYLVIAIGCTGGRHRSISMVRAVQQFLNSEMPDFNVSVRHRDVNQKRKQKATGN